MPNRIISETEAFDQCMEAARKSVSELPIEEVRNIAMIRTLQGVGFGAASTLYVIWACQDRVRELDGLEPLT